MGSLPPPTFPTVVCTGSPAAIGRQHGAAAKAQIQRGLVFYETLFRRRCGMDWEEVCGHAGKFRGVLRGRWGGYVEEMEGIAQGAGVPFESILAMNVRTEIAYGMFNDGCTALSWKEGSKSFLAQNWDWESEQAENIIRLKIHPTSGPSIDMITEAGIIGKIGLNSAGVGVCLNAIQAKGVDFSRLPCHLALRACLDSGSREEAKQKLEKAGAASSFHILLADPLGGVGLECSHLHIIELPMSESGIVTHTNHYTKPQESVKAKPHLSDSFTRLERIDYLIKKCQVGASENSIRQMLRDEDGYPTAICRAQTETSTVASLFNIVMDLSEKKASVIVGRPTDGGAMIHLNPAD